MTETFDEHNDEHEHDGQAPALPEPDAVEDQPIAGDVAIPEPPADEASDAPTLPEPAEPAAGGEVWHGDPQAGGELRGWLDDEPPSLDPPPEFDARLAEELAAAAERLGGDPGALVREVLDRLSRQ